MLKKDRKYKGYRLRNRVFWGFLLVCLLTMMGSSLLSYFVLKNNAIEQSRTMMQKESNALMASLDYAVSQNRIETKDIPEVLENKILEIADINKYDIIIYDLKGDYLISNKNREMVAEQHIQPALLKKILRSDQRVDIDEFDEKIGANKTSSYTILKNNYLEPIGIVYLPHYHNDSAYFEVLNRYIKYMLLVNLIIILFSVWLSWVISNNLTKAITKFSELITKITLFEKEMRPIRYYHNDELSTLVKAYNKMILQISDQKERLSFIEKEEAWREMAKQIAHEVKNPLTPMKLTIQNFERKFDPNDPEVEENVKKMSETMVDHIDLIAKVANAFSQFAQLPEKNNQIFNLNQEMESILGIFNDDKVYLHANRENIMMKMDKIYLNRIITNLVTNAIQAKSDDREPIINVDVEQINKRINISIQDNGIGIPSGLQGKIFEPNFTSKSSGMGLGLTMVRKMVEDYKGSITFSSEEGVGTTFLVSLPNNL